MVTDSDDEPKIAAVETDPPPPPRVPSDTVGTGSYVAVSCTVMAVLATLLLIAGLLIARWLT